MISLEHKLVTDFHRQLASSEWLDLCARFITERVEQHPEYWTNTGHGILSSQYNEERFMGPRSACKYWFNVAVCVRRPSLPWLVFHPGKRRQKEAILSGRPARPSRVVDIPTPSTLHARCDSYSAEIRFDPKQNTFRVRNENEYVHTEEIARRDRRNQKELRRLAGSIRADFPLESLTHPNCPWCNGTVQFHPDGKSFTLSCGNSDCNARVKSEMKFEVSQPPRGGKLALSSSENIESVSLKRYTLEAFRVEYITAGKALQSPRYWRIEEWSAGSSSLSEIEPDGRAYTLLNRLLETLLAVEAQDFSAESVLDGVYYEVTIVHSNGHVKGFHLFCPNVCPDWQIRDVGVKLDELFDLLG